MDINDIAKIQITGEMEAEARADQQFHTSVSVGQKTRADYDERDFIGSLGHQIVEKYIISTAHISDRYKSFRTERRIDRGDDMDIFFNDDAIDVKATHGALDEMYYYNKGFLVYDKQLKDPKYRVISHFVFTQIDIKLHIGYIYGIIDKARFMEHCKPVQLNNLNQEIRAYRLTPLHAYLYHKRNKLIDFRATSEAMATPQTFVDRTASDKPIDMADYNRRVREKQLQMKQNK